MRAIRSAFVISAVLAACDEPGGRGGQLLGDATLEDTTRPDAAGTTTSTGPTDVTQTSPSDTGGDTAVSQDTRVDDTGVAPDTSGPPPVVDPGCLDGQYDEPLPNLDGDISALVSGYSAAGYLAFADAVLGVRYPLGQHLVRQAIELGSDSFGNCIERFTRDRSTARGLIGDLSTVVHECGHVTDLSLAGFSNSIYVITQELDFDCPNAAARAGKTFARSLLNGDEYAALLPDDFYKDVYLDGDPDDGTFDSGDQGYDSVLEEATQYVNSLVTAWAFLDQAGGFSTSARDGILTFMWYLERYLRMARLEFPAAYQLISANKCWREATLTVWGRGWMYLELTGGERQLGIDDDVIEELVRDPELLAEIDRLRAAAGCP